MFLPKKCTHKYAYIRNVFVVLLSIFMLLLKTVESQPLKQQQPKIRDATDTHEAVLKYEHNKPIYHAFEAQSRQNNNNEDAMEPELRMRQLMEDLVTMSRSNMAQTGSIKNSAVPERMQDQINDETINTFLNNELKRLKSSYRYIDDADTDTNDYIAEHEMQAIFNLNAQTRNAVQDQTADEEVEETATMQPLQNAYSQEFQVIQLGERNIVKLNTLQDIVPSDLMKDEASNRTINLAASQIKKNNNYATTTAKTETTTDIPVSAIATSTDETTTNYAASKDLESLFQVTQSGEKNMVKLNTLKDTATSQINNDTNYARTTTETTTTMPISTTTTSIDEATKNYADSNEFESLVQFIATSNNISAENVENFMHELDETLNATSKDINLTTATASTINATNLNVATPLTEVEDKADSMENYIFKNLVEDNLESATKLPKIETTTYMPISTTTTNIAETTINYVAINDLESFLHFIATPNNISAENDENFMHELAATLNATTESELKAATSKGINLTTAATPLNELEDKADTMDNYNFKNLVEDNLALATKLSIVETTTTSRSNEDEHTTTETQLESKNDEITEATSTELASTSELTEELNTNTNIKEFDYLNKNELNEFTESITQPNDDDNFDNFSTTELSSMDADTTAAESLADAMNSIVAAKINRSMEFLTSDKDTLNLLNINELTKDTAAADEVTNNYEQVSFTDAANSKAITERSIDTTEASDTFPRENVNIEKNQILYISNLNNSTKTSIENVAQNTTSCIEFIVDMEDISTTVKCFIGNVNDGDDDDEEHSEQSQQQNVTIKNIKELKNDHDVVAVAVDASMTAIQSSNAAERRNQKKKTSEEQRLLKTLMNENVDFGDDDDDVNKDIEDTEKKQDAAAAHGSHTNTSMADANWNNYEISHVAAVTNELSINEKKLLDNSGVAMRNVMELNMTKNNQNMSQTENMEAANKRKQTEMETFDMDNDDGNKDDDDDNYRSDSDERKLDVATKNETLTMNGKATAEIITLQKEAAATGPGPAAAAATNHKKARLEIETDKKLRSDVAAAEDVEEVADEDDSDNDDVISVNFVQPDIIESLDITPYNNVNHASIESMMLTSKEDNSDALAEIETTNWWQILPYTEIRKFLNTIYEYETK